MHLVFYGLIFLSSEFAQATSIVEKDLRDILKQTSVIVIGYQTKVDMIDENGKQITDAQARTGPGSKNTLRNHIRVDHVLYNKHNVKIPQTLIVPEWEMWHKTLGDQATSEKPSKKIYLLKTNKDQFDFAYMGNYSYDLHQEKEIMDLIKEGVNKCFFEKVVWRMEERNEEETQIRTGIKDIPTAYLNQNHHRIQWIDNHFEFQQRDGTDRQKCLLSTVSLDTTTQAWWLRNSPNKVLVQHLQPDKTYKLELANLQNCEVEWTQTSAKRPDVKRTDVLVSNKKFQIQQDSKGCTLH